MLYDRLSIVNTALLRTGNIPCQEGDGSPEWLNGSDSYDKRLAEVIYAHNWSFATTTATLSSVGISDDPDFPNAFAKPIDCMFVLNLLGQPASCPSLIAIDYDILDNAIICNLPDSAPICKYVRRPPDDRWPPGFIGVVTTLVIADIYRGLNQDPDEADKAEARAEKLLMMARARASQEAPAKPLFISRMKLRRGVRRGGNVPGINLSTNSPTTSVPLVDEFGDFLVE